ASVRAETHRLYGDHDAPPATTAARPARRRRPLAVATGAAALALGGVAGAAIILNSGDGTVRVDPAAVPAIRVTADLRQAPWLFQQGGSPHIATVAPAGSLQFPPGTGYPRAVEQLVRSALTRGTLPAGSSPGPPLPEGVVWRPGGPGEEPRLSLIAPLGYTVPEGRVRAPSFSFDPDITFRQAEAILARLRRGALIGAGAARGLSVDVPRLPQCQIQPPDVVVAPCRIDPPPAAGEPGA
ncbi:MAG: hypothetical protein RJQ03_00550, partial [Miltoncostaeaceae bacterium]